MGIWTMELKMDDDEARLVRSCLSIRAGQYQVMADQGNWGVTPEKQRAWGDHAKMLRNVISRIEIEPY